MEENLAIRIKSRRNILGLTQKKLGNKVGVSDVTISRWENGERDPKTEELKKLAEALETSTDYLLKGEEGKKSDFEKLLKGLTDFQYSPLLKDISKEEKVKDPLLGLTYWGGVVDNARRVASEGTEQEKAEVLRMLNTAANALQGNLTGKTPPQKIGVQQNNFNGDNNYNEDIPKVATA